MAKFLEGNALNTELENIFEHAEEKLILISPFIQLHERIKSTLKAKKENHKLELIVVFGKNEDNLRKSITVGDIDFLKAFPNVQIRYEKRLHAKYYANEKRALLTSMNLFRYSQDNNIEAGILTESLLSSTHGDKLLSNITGSESIDTQAWNYFHRVIEQSELLFHNSPVYESTLLGLVKTYKRSEIKADQLAKHFTDKQTSDSTFSKVKEQTINYQPRRENQNPTGYCIRTGIHIPFNVEKPLSHDAFKVWSKFSDRDFPEKYCHFSGEPSNGETSVAKPILKKNWNKAKEIFGFKN